MGSDEKKRRHERFLLDRFLKQRRLRPKSIEQPKPPNPDFIINLDGRMVGIEMTEIFIRSDKSTNHLQSTEGLLLQEFESITDHIVSQAREIYFETNDTLVLSKILFSQVTRDKRKRRQIAEMIAHKIQDMVSGSSSKVVEWKPDVLDKEAKLLSETVAFIHIYRVPEERFARWTVMRAGLVVKLTPKHLQDRINIKSQKLKSYREDKNFGEIWLLLVADRTRPSQKFERRSDSSFNSLSSPFDKTFYYCYAADEQIVEL